MQMREKVGKSRNIVFFQWFVAPEGRKVGLLKRRVRSQLARWEMNNCMPLWREAHFEVNMYKAHHCRTTFGSCDVKKVHAPLWREAHFEVKTYKTHQVRTTFGSWDVEKVHAVVARSTFRSQNVQNTPAPDHFWKLRCRKSVRRCGAKHISKSKCEKHHMFGPLLEVQMWKSARRMARSTCRTDHFWRFRCRFAWQAQGIVHLVKSEQDVDFCDIFNYNHHYTTLHSTTLQLHLHNYTPLHSTTLHYTPHTITQLHYTRLHYTTLHYITLNDTAPQIER